MDRSESGYSPDVNDRARISCSDIKEYDMTDKATELPGNPEKDPDDWTTGDEKMTGPQASYLQTLKQEAGEDFDASLSKADASKEIDRLQEATGRGDS